MSHPIRSLCLALVVVAGAPLDLARAQEVRVYVSSKAGDRLTEKPALRFEPARTSAAAVIDLDEAVTFQKIDGFGASFLEAGLIALNVLPPVEQERVLAMLFDPGHGAGFSAMKTVVAGTDFMSAGPWYTYDDTPGDVAMTHFSIDRDLGPNGQITFITRARRHGTFVLQAPMDYPPDWMLTNATDRAKQDVDPRYFDALALYYLRYLQAYQEHGVFIDYLSLFNEPGIYTKIPFTSIRDLLRDHVGPLFASRGVKTRIQLSEASNRDEAARNYPTLLDDPGARRFVAGLPYHGYDFTSFDAIAALHARYPDLPLWMTEVCWAYEAGAPKGVPLPRYDWEDGDFWGNQIFSDLEAYSSAWIYWNMILDEHGGPWLTSPVHGNPDPNVQHPIVVINRQTKQVSYTALYYYLAHFSRFVRPGAIRIGVRGGMPKLRALAFKRPEGGFVVQLLNSRAEDADMQVRWRGRAVSLRLPAFSISTVTWQ